MDHPAIAKVFDAGSTPEGRPYFVMEYVAGIPITDHCDKHKLTTRQRLELFILVCEGVLHAHQKAIIHRDLKPSNILVTEIDGRPMPRIIDFGVAKATLQRLTAEAMQTRTGTIIGTLGYMSPEQADSAGEDIDTRTDVYSLGVILYEVLVGELPFDFNQLALSEVLRRLREQDPPRPSTKLRTRGGNSAIAAKNRAADISTLSRQLRGDLDSIALKTLEKDRARRYASPSDLAADIGHFLRNEPVTAHPPSVTYRVGKYVRRHKFGAAVAAIGALLLIGFAVAQMVAFRRITRERDRADRIAEFMTNIFNVSNPSEARGNTVTAREILDKASQQFDTELANDPQLQAEMIYTVATTYDALGLYSRAYDLAESALDKRRGLLGRSHPETLKSMTQVGWLLYRKGRDPDAEKLLREAIDQDRKAVGAEDPVTLEAMDDLAIVLGRQGRYGEEERLEHELTEIRARTFGSENPLTLRSRANLAEALSGESRFADAEKEYRQLLVIQRRTLGDDHPVTLATKNNLGNALQEQGRYDEAEALYRETLNGLQRVLGPDHTDTADIQTGLAISLAHTRIHYAEAEDLFRKSMETQLRLVGPDHPNTLRAEEGLANLLCDEDHYAEAEKLIRDILAIRQRTLGPEHTDTLLAQYNLANVLFRERRFGEADKLFRDTLRSQARVLGPEDPDTLASMAYLARVLLKEKIPQKAEPLAKRSFDAQLRILGPQHSDTLASLQYWGESLVDTHRYDEAKSTILAVIQKIADQRGDTSYAWYVFACVAAHARDREDAFDYLHRAIESGYADTDSMREEADFESLHNDPRFELLIRGALQAVPESASKP